MKFRLLFVAALLVAGTASAESPDPLRILVYGATGKVGTHVVDEALARGHLVTSSEWIFIQGILRASPRPEIGEIAQGTGCRLPMVDILRHPGHTAAPHMSTFNATLVIILV